MTGVLLSIVLWLAGGYVGARIAAFLNRGNKLQFWGQIAAGLLGGIILGWLLDRFPLLEPVTRFLHNGQVEDAIAGVLGGLAFGTLGQLFASRKAGTARNGAKSGDGGDGSVAAGPVAGGKHGHDGPGDTSPGDSSGGDGGGGGGD